MWQRTLEVKTEMEELFQLSSNEKQNVGYQTGQQKKVISAAVALVAKNAELCDLQKELLATTRASEKATIKDKITSLEEKLADFAQLHKSNILKAKELANKSGDELQGVIGEKNEELCQLQQTILNSPRQKRDAYKEQAAAL